MAFFVHLKAFYERNYERILCLATGSTILSAFFTWLGNYRQAGWAKASFIIFIILLIHFIYTCIVLFSIKEEEEEDPALAVPSVEDLEKAH